MEQVEQEPQEPFNPFTRFSDIIPTDALSSLRVVMIGAGGIGAPAAVCLSKCGISQLEIWDFDRVSEENIGPQMYGPRQIGQQKVSALRRLVNQQSDWCEVKAHNIRFNSEEHFEHLVNADVIVSAVDSLSVRKDIWSGVPRDGRRRLLIDPRMGAEVLTVFSVLPGISDRWYEKTLEGDPVMLPCTAKSTFYTGFIAGAMVAQAIKSWVTKERVLKEVHMDLRYLTMFGTESDKGEEAGYLALPG